MKSTIILLVIVLYTMFILFLGDNTHTQIYEALEKSSKEIIVSKNDTIQQLKYSLLKCQEQRNLILYDYANYIKYVNDSKLQ